MNVIRMRPMDCVEYIKTAKPEKWLRTSIPCTQPDQLFRHPRGGLC